VPSGVAALIIEGNYYGSVTPRLLKTYIGDSGYVEILFQVLGPKGQRLKYKKADPESLPLAALGKEAHYTAYVDQVEYLKQEKRYDEAIALLLKLVAETEKEAKGKNCGVAPWYYEQLAIVYRKTKRLDDEIQILERYESQPKAPGVSPEKLAERLKKARENLGKHLT
jgi:tetratricopeptide (TPR) repeat protein